MTQLTPIRLSTRALLLFKVLVGISLLIVPFLVVLAITEQSWPFLLLVCNWVIIAIYIFRGMRRLRTVV